MKLKVAILVLVEKEDQGKDTYRMHLKELLALKDLLIPVKALISGLVVPEVVMERKVVLEAHTGNLEREMV
jgi:hypothetical protein